MLKKKVLTILLILLFLLVVAVAVSAVHSRTWLIVREWTVSTPRISQEFTAVVIADLHGSSFGTQNEQLVEKIKEQQPDLILIDGGIGQVNAVDQVLKSLNLDIPIAGLAKRDEEIWRPYAEKPVCLPKRSDALRLLQRVRDETHRFATSRNQRLRTKENTVSIFLEIPKIGEKRARTLTKKFTTLENMCAADESTVAQTLHVRADEATEIILAAKHLLEKRNARKEEQMHSLKSAGTTWQKAADAQYINDLADAALLAAEEEPEFGKE